MTRKDAERARALADELVRHARGGNREIAIELQRLLGPQLTLGEIITTIHAPTHKDRAATIGISRQAYYNLIQGIARPSIITTKRLADLTGLSEEMIRDAGP